MGTLRIADNGGHLVLDPIEEHPQPTTTTTNGTVFDVTAPKTIGTAAGATLVGSTPATHIRPASEIAGSFVSPPSVYYSPSTVVLSSHGYIPLFICEATQIHIHCTI